MFEIDGNRQGVGRSEITTVTGRARVDYKETIRTLAIRGMRRWSHARGARRSHYVRATDGDCERFLNAACSTEGLGGKAKFYGGASPTNLLEAQRTSYLMATST
jgi:hypothetical protein